MRGWFAWLLISAGLPATATVPVIQHGADFVGDPVTPVVIHIEQDTLPPPHAWQPGDPIREIPIQIAKGYEHPAREPRGFDQDPLQNTQFASRNRQFGNSGLENLLVNVPGSPFGGVTPADTVGDVGPDYYVQLINHSQGSNVRILNKLTGSLVQFFILDSLAAGSGTNCVAGNGDPIVMFDQSVDNGPGEPRGRWVLTEFVRGGINSLCMYVSQTSDPTAGSWFLYEFDSITGQIPDYPKYGVWPDAYYVGVNEIDHNNGGPLQYAFDRVRMLAGQPARAPQAFSALPLDGFVFQHMMPVDWDGQEPPPPGSPGLFMRHRDTELHGPANMQNADIIELFEFSVNFSNSNASTFTGPFSIPVSEFDSEFCNLIFSGCLQQPGSGVHLFALLQPIMWRAQYRNFGSHQSIVSNLITDVTGDDIGGVRWFELRSFGSGYNVFQEGTVTEPGGVDGTDGINRWMGSVAQDQAGNIVAGYNVTGLGGQSPADDIFPGMRYSGRQLSDPPGALPQGEFSIVEGLFHNASFRYGDYSALSVDPIDGCTFWYTAQHNPLANNNWATRAASFRFDDCGDDGFILAADNLRQQLCTPDSLEPISVHVGSIFGFSNPVSLALASPPPGVSAGFSPNPVTPGNVSTLNINFSGQAVPGQTIIEIEGSASGADDRNLFATVDVYNQSPGTLVNTAPADGQILVSTQPVMSWSGGAQAAEFVLEIDDDPAFASIDYTATVTGLMHTVMTPLAYEQQYYWRTRAVNACAETTGPVYSFTTRPPPGQCPAGTSTRMAFFDDMENGDNGWTHAGINDTWQRSSLETSSGDFAWFAEDLPIISDQQLISPAVALPLNELPIELRYQNSQTIEDDPVNGACWDAGILEISTDDGTNWMQLSGTRLFTDQYDGVVNTSAAGMNPLTGLQGWCGDPQPFIESIVDLSDFAGETVSFRFRLGTDSTLGRINDGWFIDDVRVQSCNGDEDILIDGFE